MMDSSRAEVCSGEVPFLEGRRAEGDSFSTCWDGKGGGSARPQWAINPRFVRGIRGIQKGEEGEGDELWEEKRTGVAYGNLEIDHLLRKRAHLVVEAEPVLSRLFRREHGVQLAFLGALHDDLVVGTGDNVVDIEGAA